MTDSKPVTPENELLITKVEVLDGAYITALKRCKTLQTQIAILEKAVADAKEQTVREIFETITAKMYANKVREGTPIIWQYQLKTIQASYLKGGK